MESILRKSGRKGNFQSFYIYQTKRIERLPIITYLDRNNERKDRIIFNQKCDALLTSLFYPPPASEPPDLSSYIEKEWEWPEILTDKIKETIFSSSSKKT